MPHTTNLYDPQALTAPYKKGLGFCAGVFSETSELCGQVMGHDYVTSTVFAQTMEPSWN